MTPMKTVSTARIFSDAVEIGEALPPDVRPFYVAFIEPVSRFGDGTLWAKIGAAIGVKEISELAGLLVPWGEATERDDWETCEAIEAHLDAAGVSECAWMAIRAAGCLSARMAAYVAVAPDRRLHY